MKKIKRIKIVLLFALLFITLAAEAARDFREQYYQNIWCSRFYGVPEVKLPDKTRVDCVTKHYAVEFDFADKWAEGLGQSLHYARMTGKNPAVVLIIEDPADFVYYERLKPLQLLNVAPLIFFMIQYKYDGTEYIF